MTHTVALEPVGPDRVRGSLPCLPLGHLNGLVLAVREPGKPAQVVTGAVGLAYGRERAARGVDEDFFVRAASALGARRAGPGPIPLAPRPVEDTKREPWAAALFLAACLLIPLDVCLRRLGV